MTLGQLTQLVMRLQADVRAFAEAVATYDGWQDIPGDSRAFCADTADSVAFELELLRATLHAEHQAMQPAESEA
jgi:hypothetical protein